MWNFTGRKAIVTGGASGIGRTIAEMLEQAGAEVHVFDLSMGDAESSPGTFHEVNIGDPASVQAAVDSLPNDVTLLVNNAGITRDKSIAKMSDDEWSSVININLGGAFYLIRALAPRLREQGYGRIVNITSINGMRGKFGQANYSSAKAGMIGLTKTAARELGGKGVTVNAVAPGMVLTEMAKKLPPEFLQKALDETVLKELATPEDIANAVLFLLSDAARMITGEVIKVDSGQYI
ncbi:MAG: 3-oxoacyl-ACP reductase FabG [Sedimenticola sp.]|uniref:SDR family oxidoreductase n=1 Tax=Sedimenticola thiotaurini TaxID=1543721 RepID=A0A558CZI1_9GAMM|nr:3-oxoacyl-ACP reductase FabG [Sedimenticola sp.]MCW8974475.1 3-oxoacyl-ACP reductase FabG [Sedimenticola sp.]MCW9021879.1 3-oxoacyl-ACP reductase FabG [Sedimenticola sp.]TVT54148.1 MAG: SDR family oxidoreductase [Sedimenticola thiotaurini]